eukprot:GFUD01030486.1.p1 GENE.GFUD01030486.1~~GFUD01030486.1.p1  ORF type:complete len:350 (-),score=63.70 GFUD01030486.1:208-1257(-)
MIPPAIFLLLSLLSSVAGQQCSTSADCPTPDAPHCSKWGWCQWTAQYGDGGPSQLESDDAPLGSCRSAEDCTPRAPVCSNQGFCTAKQSHQQAPEAPRGNARSQSISNQGPRGQTTNQRRNNHQNHQTSRTASASSHRVSRTQQQFLKSQANHLDRDLERQSVTNNFKRSSGHGNQNRNGNNQIKQKHTKRILEPRPAVPDQTTKSSRNLPQRFEPLIAVPVPGIQRRVRTTTTTVPPPDYIDRISTDYYDQYDYNYYTEFEVMKMKEPEVSTSLNRGQSTSSTPQRDSGSRSQGHSQPAPRPAPRRALPASISQGCLADCVTDCVVIQQLTAYRDCVEFCGKTCNDKK